MNKISIAFVDDHKLLRAGLIELINDFKNCTVMLEAGNGKEFTQQLNLENLPQIVLLDISMPVMNGYDTAAWLQQNHPGIKIIVLSQFDEEFAIARMVNLGACAFLVKDEEPEILEEALNTVHQTGFYFGGQLGSLVRQLLQPSKYSQPGYDTLLSETEIRFLELSGSSLTYNQIGDELSMTVKQVEHLRDRLCTQFDLKTRPQLAVFALSNGLTLPPVNYTVSWQ